MFNRCLKNEAIDRLEATNNRYNAIASSVRDKSVSLYNLRSMSSNEVIAAVESYINKLANSPKEFDKSFSTYKAEFKLFTDLLDELKIEADKAKRNLGSATGAGVAAGVGVAAFAPTAAMAIATTFGTASTGTAIASLSGAAATNAALAWLGGGALAAGGGGITAGNALLALAGPIGWAIGGSTLVIAGFWANSKNKEIAQKANAQRKEIEVSISTLNAAEYEIKSLISQTQQHNNGVKELLAHLKAHASNNYMEFTTAQKEKLAALINHIQSLSKLLNKKVA